MSAAHFARSIRLAAQARGSGDLAERGEHVGVDAGYVAKPAPDAGGVQSTTGAAHAHDWHGAQGARVALRRLSRRGDSVRFTTPLL